MRYNTAGWNLNILEHCLSSGNCSAHMSTTMWVVSVWPLKSFTPQICRLVVNQRWKWTPMKISETLSLHSSVTCKCQRLQMPWTPLYLFDIAKPSHAAWISSFRPINWKVPTDGKPRGSYTSLHVFPFSPWSQSWNAYCPKAWKQFVSHILPSFLVVWTDRVCTRPLISWWPEMGVW